MSSVYCLKFLAIDEKRNWRKIYVTDVKSVISARGRHTEVPSITNSGVVVGIPITLEI